MLATTATGRGARADSEVGERTLRTKPPATAAAAINVAAKANTTGRPARRRGTLSDTGAWGSSGAARRSVGRLALPRP